MTKPNYVIIKGGMGAMLNPPNDVEHKYSVAIRDKYGTSHGAMSIRYALAADNIPDDIKTKLSNLMQEHQGELTKEWEHTSYNYYRDCYSPNTTRDLNHMVVDKDNDIPPERHLAVLHIQSYFPDYKPNSFLIANNGELGDWSNVEDRNQRA